ncbi:MAG: aspartate--tRNA(Asn) ligase [archaeon]|jgi:aspartyl-tRNA synthetase
MERVMIKEVAKHIGEKILLKGFIQEIRDQSKVKFVILRDISGIVQCVALPEEKEIFSTIGKIPKESVIELVGIIKAEKQAPSGCELKIESCKILSEADKELPIQVIEKGTEETTLPLRLDYRWIDLRKPKSALIFKIWTTMEAAMREYWLSHGFIQIHSPKLVAGATESGAELFSLDYFGKKASLAQSPQFYKQMAMSAGLEKVFEIGPVFRANPSHTTRHDTEFTSVDVEISFVESEETVMQLEEEWLAHVLTRVKEKHGEEIKKIFGEEVVVPTLPFPRITMEEAHKVLKKEFDYKIKDSDLDPEGERLLFEYVKKKFKHEFVFVKEYPVSVRPFYHMRKEGEPTITKSFDLLWKGLEITTGAQREHHYEQLKKQAVEKKVPAEGIKEYLEFFRYGCPPHGGYGLSPSRMLMLLLGLKNVREVTFLPRDTERLNP